MSATAVTLSSIYSRLNPGQDSKKDERELHVNRMAGELVLKGRFLVFKTPSARLLAATRARDQVYGALLGDVAHQLGVPKSESKVTTAAEQIWNRNVPTGDRPITLRLVKKLKSDVQDLEKHPPQGPSSLSVPQEKSESAPQGGQGQGDAPHPSKTKTVRNPAYSKDGKSKFKPVQAPSDSAALPAFSSSALVSLKDRSITRDACIPKLEAQFFQKSSEKLTHQQQNQFLRQLAELVDLAQVHRSEWLSLTDSEQLQPGLIEAAQKLLDGGPSMTPRSILGLEPKQSE